MPQYMLSVHGSDTDPMPPPEQVQQMFADVAAFNDEVQAAGAWVFGGGLHPADTATVVRVEAGDVVTTDGPYVESKEHLGGFWIITAPDLDTALRWAEKGSRACQGPVEVRPFQDD
jgi:hypothetical protein